MTRRKYTSHDILEWMRLRTLGVSPMEIAKRFDATQEYVRAATSRVVTDDAKLHDDKIVFL